MSTDAENAWRDIPIAERFELLATIREMREWRFGGDEPLRLGPVWRAAFELHQWRNRTCDKGPSTRRKHE